MNYALWSIVVLWICCAIYAYFHNRKDYKLLKLIYGTLSKEKSIQARIGVTGVITIPVINTKYVIMNWEDGRISIHNDIECIFTEGFNYNNQKIKFIISDLKKSFFAKVILSAGREKRFTYFNVELV